MGKPDKWTANQVIEKLQIKYGDSLHFAFFEQVGAGTGQYCNSWIDAIVCDLWPSTGLTRRAFEVKVSRADFMNEIQSSGKNEWARKYCHEFWYATGPGVVKTADEIPINCGWMKATKGGMRIMKAAQRQPNPEMPEAFVAALMRAAQKKEQKHGEKLKADLRAELFETDDEIKILKAVNDGYCDFMASRDHHVRRYQMTKESVMLDLKQAVENHDLESLRCEVHNHLSGFEDRVSDLFMQFCVIANIAFDAVDETGANIIQSWRTNTEGIAFERENKSIRERTEQARALLKAMNEEQAVNAQNGNRMVDPFGDNLAF